MDWKMDPAVQGLISPSLARNFRVIPLGEEGGCVKLLMGRRQLTKNEKHDAEAMLEFYLGRAVILETLEEYESSIGTGFDEILDYYYATPLPDMLSRPIARHVATVLLVDADPSRRKRTSSQLTQQGFIVKETATVEDAIALLQDRRCGVTEVLLPQDLWSDEGVHRQLAVLGDVRIDTVAEALKRCDCPLTV